MIDAFEIALVALMATLDLLAILWAWTWQAYPR